MWIQMPLCLASACKLKAERHHITKTKPNHPTVLLIRGNMTPLVLQSRGSTAPSHLHMHLNSGCVQNICRIRTHVYGCKHAGYADIHTHTHTHTVCSYYFMKDGKETSVPPPTHPPCSLEHEWYGFLPAGLTCYSAKLLSFSSPGLACSCITFYISPCHCPKVKQTWKAVA